MTTGRAVVRGLCINLFYSIAGWDMNIPSHLDIRCLIPTLCFLLGPNVPCGMA